MEFRSHRGKQCCWRWKGDIATTPQSPGPSRNSSAFSSRGPEFPGGVGAMKKGRIQGAVSILAEKRPGMQGMRKLLLGESTEQQNFAMNFKRGTVATPIRPTESCKLLLPLPAVEKGAPEKRCYCKTWKAEAAEWQKGPSLSDSLALKGQESGYSAIRFIFSCLAAPIASLPMRLSSPCHILRPAVTSL